MKQSVYKLDITIQLLSRLEAKTCGLHGKSSPLPCLFLNHLNVFKQTCTLQVPTDPVSSYYLLPSLLHPLLLPVLSGKFELETPDVECQR